MRRLHEILWKVAYELEEAFIIFRKKCRNLFGDRDTINWLQTVLGDVGDAPKPALKSLKDKFELFLTILDRNNQALKVMSDMEEKAQGEYLFDINYIHTCLSELRLVVTEIIDKLIMMGEGRYKSLRSRYFHIDSEIRSILPGNQPIPEDDFTIPFEKLGRERASSVGSKNAQLGEMKSKLGLPVPDGFAISAWAYKYFIDANNLQARISERINALDIQRYDDLVRVSEEVRDMIMSSSVPDDLAEEIQNRYSELKRHFPSKGFSLRSSAIGEDTLFSFAGQYATFLNIKEPELLERYREIVASKFTPKAIYYFLSHSLTESELAISVGCMAMVDAKASGVVYTMDPVRPGDGCLIVSSVYGLGRYLVDGTITPDIFRVSRKDRSLEEARLSRKPVRLVMKASGGTVEEKVPEPEQEAPSIDKEHLCRLVEIAMKIEQYYGCPQDIEWAIDRDGELFLLQTRPLRIVESRDKSALPDISKAEVLLSGGTAVCPGAGGGPVFHASSTRDLPLVPRGAVLVSQTPFPGLITAMGKVSAIITEVGGISSHMATIAREYRVPTVAGFKEAKKLMAGEPVTVDATAGVVYKGIHPDLMAARRPEYEFFGGIPIFDTLKQILEKVSSLNLIDPKDPDFAPDNCRTFHDITRFAHQKAMEEMFQAAKNMENKERVGLELKSDIPLPIDIINLDWDRSSYKGKTWIKDNEFESAPMEAFWKGFVKEGWPAPPPVNLRGFMSVMATHMIKGEREDFFQKSFAILSKEYMLLSLHMGYHFTTIEAMCTKNASKNYIRMQYKEGGASLDRRIRRIRLVMDLLSKMGFEHSGEGDFLDSMIAHLDSGPILEKLYILGRINMMTKQLDMALASDSITRWYTEDFMKKLGLQR